MSTLTSEAAITAIEQSLKPTVELLDDAATIIGLSHTEQGRLVNSNDAPTSTFDSANFREQWILRWIIKRLNQAIDIKQTPKGQQDQLLGNLKTWDLIIHLLDAIPKQVSRDILLERGFCQTFSKCLAVCQDLKAASDAHESEVSESKRFDLDDSEPRKRRKLDVPKCASELPEGLLRVAYQVADIITSEGQAKAPHQAYIPVDWADSVDGAAVFLARLIRIANLATTTATPFSQDYKRMLKVVSDALSPWIELWQAQASATYSSRKQDSHSAFANFALIPSLDFLAQTPEGLLRTVSKALERQVATFFVLPNRAVFQKRFANSWKSWRTEPQVDEIQKIMKALTTSLGNAAVDFCTSKGESRAGILIGIASRIIPRSDVVQRKADAPWVEALFLCLSCLLNNFPQGGISKSPSSLLTTSVNGDLTYTKITASNNCLDALRQANVEPSVHVWRYFLRHSLINADHAVSSSALTKIVALNASVFVPSGEDTGTWLLDALCENLEESLKVYLQSSESLVLDILAPIMEEFGRTNRLGAFISFWETKLTEEYYHRASTKGDHSSHTLWDHPDFIKEFSLVCRRYAQPSICTDQLEIVAKDIGGLVEVVGPVHSTFARSTILMPILCALGKNSTIQSFVYQHVSLISTSVYEALRSPTDYQSYRWKLWSLLDLFAGLLPEALEFKAIQDQTLPCPFFTIDDPGIKGVRNTQVNSQHMEKYCCFSLMMTCYENCENYSNSILASALETLDDWIKVCKKHAADSKQVSNFWDGTVDTMNSTFTLLSAYLMRLAASPTCVALCAMAPNDFLTNVASLNLDKIKMQQPSIASAAESLLVKLASSGQMDPIGIYCAAITENEQNSTMPKMLHSLAVNLASKHQLQTLIRMVCNTLEGSISLSDGAFIDHLSLLDKIVTCNPASVSLGPDVVQYKSFLERSTTAATLEQLIIGHNCVQATLRSKISWCGSDIETDGAQPTAMVIFEWVKKQLKKMGSLGKPKILNQYTGFLSLTIAQLTHEIKTAPKPLQKTIDKIKKYHNPAMLQQCKLYLEEATNICSLYKVLSLLDSLAFPLEDQSLNEILQTCLQRLVQSILVMDAGKDEPNISAQEVAIIAKFWQILSRHADMRKHSTVPSFPFVEFSRRLKYGDSEDAIRLQALLGDTRPDQILVESLSSHVKSTDRDIQVNGQEPASPSDLKPYISIAAKISNMVLDTASTDTVIIEVLGQLAYLQNAVDVASPDALVARLELSKLILEKHPSIVNQHVIDSALESISLLATSRCKTGIDTISSQIRPEHIFDRLCAILSVFLVRYRRRLTGRLHLLLPALQNLLKCLFCPPTWKHLTTTSTSQAVYLASLPNWLNPLAHASTVTLPQTSATRFSRVLQQLCDPSASAARHVSRQGPGASTPTNNLVDETKALRRQVSQHTQYLLQTYCDVMLAGYIAPDVKERLVPGLYAVMNATEVEVMRALNAAMDVSQRAIWKGLYSDWKTYGKWNQR